MFSTHCFLRTENRSISHGVVTEFCISHKFQHKNYISIVHSDYGIPACSKIQLQYFLLAFLYVDGVHADAFYLAFHQPQLFVTQKNTCSLQQSNFGDRSQLFESKEIRMRQFIYPSLLTILHSYLAYHIQ